MVPTKKNKKEFVVRSIHDLVLWSFNNLDKDLDIDVIFVKLVESVGPDIGIDVMTKVSDKIKEMNSEDITDVLRELSRIAYRMEME